jgi:hypothetical protein
LNDAAERRELTNAGRNWFIEARQCSRLHCSNPEPTMDSEDLHDSDIHEHHEEAAHHHEQAAKHHRRRRLVNSSRKRRLSNVIVRSISRASANCTRRKFILRRTSRPHLAAVLLEGRKCANIHASLGVIRGIPA